MQATPQAQRSFQRRPPRTSAQSQAGPPSERAMSPVESSRSMGPPSERPMQNGGGSTSSSSKRRENTGPPLSQIEKSVTHLLVATKQLLETLTQWSRNKSTDAQVSDVYVRLGYEFNIACRAFTAIGVDVNDLGNVPEMLREILENTLSQEASVESLDRYLPRIRDIIINLLHGLKRKQQKLRLSTKKDGEGSQLRITNGQNGQPVQPVHRGMSMDSMASTSSNLTTLLNAGVPDKYRTAHATDPRHSYLSSVDQARRDELGSASSPSRKSANPTRLSGMSNESSLSSNAAQAIPLLLPGQTEEDIPDLPPPPPPPDHSNPFDYSNLPKPPSEQSLEPFDVSTFPPPPPPPKQEFSNALSQLSGRGELERRASRRYSAYQISKVMGVSPSGMPAMPPAQNSPIPNRGRDLRESMNAVRIRGSVLHSHQRSINQRQGAESSPVRYNPNRISEESDRGSDRNAREEPPASENNYGKESENGTAYSEEDVTTSEELENGNPAVQDPAVQDPAVQDPSRSNSRNKQRGTLMRSKSVRSSPEEWVIERVESPVNQDRPFVPETSPQPGKELTLFLQYKTKIKKFVLADGYNELSLARLQLAFIEKFAWNTHNNGNDLPEIYIQDPVSGVRHELEDLSDIKDRSVLVLNIEALDEVKRHIDDGIGGIRTMVESVKAALDAQQASIQRVSDRQQEAAKDMASLAAVPPPSSRVSLIDNPRISGGSKSLNPAKINTVAQMSELQSLRRDLAVLRQTYSGFQADVKSSMDGIRTKASSVKASAMKAAVPVLKGDSGRAYVSEGKKKLAADSDTLVNRVDDLQDIVEDLRKDVVLRGVRPLPRQLETVAKDISIATQELKKMQETLKREKPLWTKIWERELEVVCLDREDLTMQEDLATDLEDDLEKAQQTFALVEEATKEQMKEMPQGSGTRIISRTLNHVTISDPRVAKDGVLDEVRALQPNHENRLEAIERAEKLRQKELESRDGGEFQKELGAFVEQGKLKKAGGVDEVERERKRKDDRIRREVWERQNGMTAADAAYEAPAEEADVEPEVEGAVEGDADLENEEEAGAPADI